MTTNTYYVMVPAPLSHTGKAFWQELRGFNRLSAAQAHVDRVMQGHRIAEIGVSVDGGVIQAIAIRNPIGKWSIVDEEKGDE